MKKALIVFGTRPEAIKMAPVIKELQKRPEKFQVIVCVTAQHREMLDQVLNIFEIRPDIDLNIMRPNQDLTDITTQVLSGMRSALMNYRPDLVLVHGDTTTSIATALAAFYQQIPVGHVEAGLRTYDIYHPWPEEINRQITGRVATWHFAPTELNRKNLLAEGISDGMIFVTGNTVIDALQIILGKIRDRNEIVKEIEDSLVEHGLPMTHIHLWNGMEGIRKMILITGHRRENFGKGIEQICEAIGDLAQEYQNVDFVYPVHLNPNVQKPVMDVLEKHTQVGRSNIYLIKPLQYLPFIYLMKKCCLVVTDSGGIQEEAPSLAKPVLVTRSETERPEGVEAGTVILTGANKKRIKDEVSKLLGDSRYYQFISTAINPYGDGAASIRISEIISCK